MSVEYTDCELIATAVADALQFNSCQFVLVDTDGMTSALMEVTNKGKCRTVNSRNVFSKQVFYHTAAEKFLGSDHNADEVFDVCKQAKNAFKRFIKTSGVSDEALHNNLSCKELMDFYDSHCKHNVEQLAEAAKSMAPQDTRVVLVGRFAAFYPAEHTIKKAFTPMPFLPLEEFYVRDDLCVATAELALRGKLVLQKIEDATKRVFHNIMIQLKKLSDNELVDFLFMLAKKDDGFDKLEAPRYSDDVMIHEQDPVVLFADSTKYYVRLPRSVFSHGSTARVRFALGTENDVPKLLVKNGDLCTKVDIDKKIYTEV